MAIISLAGCGDDSPQSTGAGGVGGEGGTPAEGGGGSTPTVPPDVVSVRAPDETTVVVQLSGDVVDVPMVGSAFYIDSLKGNLTVGDVVYDADTKTITLTTSKQKLGVEYALTIKAPGDPLDLKFGDFLSADAATFWATHFADFSDYQVTAERVGIGENIVIYTTPDAPADDVDETIAYFDEKILPTETALFTMAPDRDENGKVVLLGLDGEGYYGGYFYPINSLTQAQAGQFGGHSNEMEMVYISTIDLGGSLGAEEVVAHEFQHLLYNETHDFFSSDWSWHNEGLAECAVHAVAGSNDYASGWYQQAPDLGNGESLVRWQYSNYDQYAQAYVFLTYVAGRLGGVDGYGQLFELSGDPADVGVFFQDQFTQSFPQVHMDMLTAVWLQDASGDHSFNGMLTLSGQVPIATAGSHELETYTGILIPANQTGITPMGQGPDVIFRAIASDGTIDDTAPFDAPNGVVIALDAKEDASDGSTEPSGTFSAGIAGPTPHKTAIDTRLWLHPPPIKPANMPAVLAWRRAAHGF